MKFHSKIFIGIFILFLSLVLYSISQEKQPQTREDLISLIKQNSGLEIQLEDIGWQWKEEDIKGTKDVENFQNHGMEEFTVNSKKITKIWGVSEFKEPENQREKEFFTGKSIYQVAQWNLKKVKKKIVVTLITKQYRYGSGISSPARYFQDRFLRDLILKTE